MRSPFLEQVKMLKYLISDMDHTLLQENGQLDQVTITAVRQSRLQLSLASARNPYSMVDFIHQLQLRGPQLAMNGAIIFEEDDHQVHIIKEHPIQRMIAKQVQTVIRENFPAVDFTWITPEHWYVPRMTKELRAEIEYSGVKPVLGATLGRTAEPDQIVLIIKDPQVFIKVQQSLETRFANLAIHNSGDGYLTINAEGVNKGNLVKFFLQQGVQRMQIAGVGDDQNDIPLLKAVGVPLAVNNASPRVKAFADHVLPSNQDDGVAKFLQQFPR